MCYRMRGLDMCKSHVVERVWDAGSVFNTGGKQCGRIGGKKGYIYSSSCDLIHILHFVG
jgi:hypothetical protein